MHVQNKYGLKEITTYVLRHTHCSLLFEAGATIKEVYDCLRYGNVQTTMNIHVTKKVNAVTIEKPFSFYPIRNALSNSISIPEFYAEFKNNTKSIKMENIKVYSD